MQSEEEKLADRKRAAESAPVTDWSLLWQSPGGIKHYWRDKEDGFEIKTVQDVAPFLEEAKRKFTHNDGWSPSKELRRVAVIPDAIAHKWLVEEGVNIHDAGHDPHAAAFLMRKLNDPDWSHLRTAPGRLGMSNGVIR